MSEFKAPKGIPDYLPPDSAQFVAVRDGLLTVARRAGYGDVEVQVGEGGGAEGGEVLFYPFG